MTARPTAKQAQKSTGPGSDDPFVYTTRAGATLTVTSMAVALNAGEIRKLRNKPASEWAFYVIERDCDTDDLEAFDAMSAAELKDDFFPQWNEHSGTSLGE